MVVTAIYYCPKHGSSNKRCECWERAQHAAERAIANRIRRMSASLIGVNKPRESDSPRKEA